METQDANETVVEEAAADGGASSALPTTGEDLIPTVQPEPIEEIKEDGQKDVTESGDDGQDEGANSESNDGANDDNAAKENEDDEGAPESGDKDGSDWDGNDTRYDKIPRFQELHQKVKQNEATITGLRAQLEAAQNGQLAESQPQQKSLLDLEDEELSAEMIENPKKFISNLKNEFATEIFGYLNEQQAQQAQQATIEKTFTTFAKEHDDFDNLWNDGTLQGYMDKNPGHNAISAYYAVSDKQQAQNTQKTIDDAVAKAVQEATDKLTKNFKAKRHARVLTAAASARPKRSKIAPDLKNPEKFGGTRAVLINRLRALRAGE